MTSVSPVHGVRGSSSRSSRSDAGRCIVEKGTGTGFPAPVPFLSAYPFRFLWKRRVTVTVSQTAETVKMIFILPPSAQTDWICWLGWLPQASSRPGRRNVPRHPSSRKQTVTSFRPVGALRVGRGRGGRARCGCRGNSGSIRSRRRSQMPNPRYSAGARPECDKPR
jgi:hypothetical protein